MPRPEDRLVGMILNGRYRVQERLGTGGMASVYRVHDELEDRAACLKVLFEGGDDSVERELLVQEFRTLKGLKHPNLEEVYDFGRLEGEDAHFFSNELVDGADLGAASKDLDFGALTECLVQICRALQYIHSRGLVHLDIKPENILVRRGPEGDPQVKIIDFGLVSKRDNPLGEEIRGTLAYVAPEILRGEASDHRADLYSLGVTLYRLLSGGEHPFSAKSDVESVLQRFSRQVDAPVSPLGDIPPYLVRVTLRLLEASPENRYPDANAIIEDIRRATRKPYPLETEESREGRVLSGRFVGREQEMETVTTLLDEAAGRGARKHVLITGEAGAGKTRFLREIAVRAQVAGQRVFRGTAPKRGAGAYAHLAGVLTELVLTLGREHPRVREHGPPLARILPARLGLGDPPPPLEGRAESIRIADAASRLVLGFARGKPTVVLLDDLDRADPGTADALAYLVRSTPASGDGAPSLLVVATIRETGRKEGPASRLFGATETKAEWTEVPLGPLDETAVQDLLESMFGAGEVPDTFLERIFAASRGNPLFLEEAVRLLAARGDLRWTGRRWAFPARPESVSIPENLEEIFDQSLRDVEEEDRGILEAMAVWGRPAGVRALQATLGGRSLASAAASLARLHGRDLAERMDEASGARWRVRGSLFEAYLYGRIPADEKKRLHGRAGAFLEEQGAEGAHALAEVSRHLLAGGRGAQGVERALEAGRRFLDVAQFDRGITVLKLAEEETGEADAATLSALHSLAGKCRMYSGDMPGALEAFRKADRHLERQGAKARKERLEILIHIGDILRVLGREEEGFRFLERSEAIAAETGDPLDAARIRLHKGNRLCVTGRVAEGFRILEEAIGDHEALLELNEGAVASLHLANREARRGDLAKAETWLAVSERYARRRGSKHGLVIAERYRGYWAMEAGRLEEARKHLEAALALVREIGHRKEEGFTLEPLVNVNLELGRYEEAERLVQEGMATFQALGDEAAVTRLYQNQSDFCLLRGEFDEAIAVQHSVLRFWQEKGHPLWIPVSELNTGQVHVATGRPAEALLHLRQALTRFRDLGQSSYMLHTRRVLGEHYLARGKWRAALRITERCLESGGPEGSIPGEGVVRSLRAMALAHLGRVKEAEEEGERASRRLAKDGNVHIGLEEAFHKALRARERGHFTSAAAGLAPVLETARERGRRSLELRALAVLGEVRVREGSLAKALLCLNRATALNQGVKGRLEGVEIRLARAGLFERLGDDAEARAAAREAIALAESLRNPALAGRARLAAGRLDRLAKRENARSHLEGALASLRRAGDHRGLCEVRLELARLLPAGEARRQRDETERLLENTGTPDLEARLALQRAESRARESGPAPGIEALLEKALTAARASGDRDLVRRAHHALACLQAGRAESGRPAPHATEARSIEEEMASDLPEARLDAFRKTNAGIRRDIERIFRPEAGAPRESAPPATTAEASPREVHTLRSILEVCKEFNAETNFPDLLTRILDDAISLFGARRGFLLIDTGKALEPLVSRNFREEDEADLRISRTLARRVFETGRGVHTGNVLEEEAFLDSHSVHALKLQSVLCAPLRSAGEAVGALYLDQPALEEAFREKDLDLLGALADLAGIAIENARLLEGLQERERELEERNLDLTEEVQTRILEVEEVRRTLHDRERELKGRDLYKEIVGESEAVRRLFSLLDRVSASALPVVLQGETGTGKELAARAVHQGSVRRARPFVSVNCAALPENLLESELFGYRKGAFTGATKDSLGLFVHADGGSLFLDEIGDMSPSLQAKLLRVLQEGEVRPLGEKTSVPVDVRILCATNRDLAERVEAGAFREDLFYRLNVLRVELPSLRERREDIPLLASHFLKEVLKKEKRKERDLILSQSALKALKRHHWPGNVRELKNTIERAAVFASSDRITAEEIELVFHREPGEEKAEETDAPGDYREAKTAFEKAYIERMLRRHEGNVTRASEEADLQRGYFHRLMKKYGLKAADFKQ